MIEDDNTCYNDFMVCCGAMRVLSAISEVSPISAGAGVACRVLVEDSFALFCLQQHFHGRYHDHIIHYMNRRVAQSCCKCNR